MKSWPGNASGTLSASASVTTPRTRAQLRTVDARGPIGAWRVRPMRRHARMIASEANIHAIYPSRRFLPARIRLFVDFLHECLQRHEAEVLDTVRRAMT